MTPLRPPQNLERSNWAEPAALVTCVLDYITSSIMNLAYSRIVQSGTQDKDHYLIKRRSGEEGEGLVQWSRYQGRRGGDHIINHLSTITDSYFTHSSVMVLCRNRKIRVWKRCLMAGGWSDSRSKTPARSHLECLTILYFILCTVQYNHLNRFE